MKKISITIIVGLLVSITSAQVFEQFNVEIEPMVIPGAPGIHSFAWAKDTSNKILIIGGRVDGLHERQPFAAFLDQDNNKKAWVIDIATQQVWSSSITGLPVSIYEQLESTNQNFYQRDGNLYVIGGYGYSATAGDHVTYPNLTAINVNGLVNAVINNSSIASYFRQITDQNLANTGGQLGYLDSVFYLVGGQRFDGRYNPMGPNNGPGFTQTYASSIKKFKIDDNGTSLVISNYSSVVDAVNLSRRDYNMAPQIFPSGDEGFTVFSGVFKQPNDEPFLDAVNVTDTGYQVIPSFNQYLSQYHSAKIPMFDVTNNTMHTLFFGGISQYTLDTLGNLVSDVNVPFVKTISRVTRFSNNTMEEVKLGVEMPTLVGSGAEFIPIHDTNYYTNREILKMNNIPQQKTLIGYIYGGIESTQANIFFINDGSQSSASSVMFKVYINKSTVGIPDFKISSNTIFNLQVYPNPVQDEFTVSFYNPNRANVSINIFDTKGALVKTILNKEIKAGNQTEKYDLNNIAKGEYLLELNNGVYRKTEKIIVK
jgi:hypothetical protein